LETSAFDFVLPDELIAQEPAEPRDHSRLLVIDRRAGRWEHRRFHELPECLAPGDVLVRNDTRVVPARLVGRREATGGHWEGLFLRALADGTWEVLARTRGKPAPGERVVVGRGLRLTLAARGEAGRWTVRPEGPGDEDRDAPPSASGSASASALLERYGQVPLPPYIRKGREGPGDRLRYQTLYARAPGAVAAPTAGLHFTDDVFARLGARGVARVDCTLHVGLGTFRPIEAERIEDHVLHAEWAELSPSAAATLNEQRRRGGRIVAVGTTSARVLETAAMAVGDGTLRPFAGETALYLRPGHVFRGLDALLTNFHLPRSSLLVLVAALAGTDLIRAAYAEAIRARYRFYSYGDAMLIL
jgi:S-adenosylmethionine:tRNA ribosyltransferase-isomerase